MERVCGFLGLFATEADTSKGRKENRASHQRARGALRAEGERLGLGGRAWSRPAPPWPCTPHPLGLERRSWAQPFNPEDEGLGSDTDSIYHRKLP